MFPVATWRSLFDVGEAVTRPTAAVLRALHKAFAKDDNPPLVYFIMVDRSELKPVKPEHLRRSVEAWQKLHRKEDQPGAFLIEFATGGKSIDLDTTIGELRDALASATNEVVTGDPEITQPRSSEALQSDQSPEQRAAIAREKVLERARTERWPQSGDVGRRLGSTRETAARQRATRMRAAGELLGLWAPAERTFYHPTFQFLPDGRVHPRVTELLATLSEIPTYAPDEDSTGWGRMAWLLQPRRSLSERGVAERLAPSGFAEDEARLDDAARAPIDLFAADPESVVALAQFEARAIRDER
jgi:hypothetical protein